MKEFLKDGSPTFKKVSINKIGAIIFGLMLSLVTTDKNNTLYIGGSILAIVFYMYLVHLVMWERGSKDRMKTDAGRGNYTQNHGLKIGLAMSVPTVVLSLLVTVGTLVSIKMPFASNISGLADVVIRIWQVMYYCVYTAIPKDLSAVQYAVYSGLFYVTALPIILMPWLSYFLGYNNLLMPLGLKPKKTEK